MSLSNIKRHVRAFARVRAVVITGVSLSVLCTLAMTAPLASASADQNPANCGNPVTWKYRDFNVAGDTVRVELRHSYPCQAGWARIEQLKGSTALSVILSAWNPGQPSQYMIKNTNWTREVNAVGGEQVCAGFRRGPSMNSARSTTSTGSSPDATPRQPLRRPLAARRTLGRSTPMQAAMKAPPYLPTRASR